MPTFGPTNVSSGNEVAYYTSSANPQKSPSISAPEYGPILMLGDLKGPDASFILRWESTGIPQGATVSEAILRWYVRDSGSADGRIRGHKVASPNHLYDDYGTPSARKTAISSAFTGESTTNSLLLTGQTAGSKAHTITDIVQEIVNVNSWNGTVQLFTIFESAGYDVNWGIDNHSNSGGSHAVSSLEVTYSGGGGSGGGGESSSIHIQRLLLGVG
jgi:hypothetical protein